MEGFLAGSIGGASGIIVGFPFDTIKSRLQTQGSSGFSSRYHGPIHCGIDIVKTEGVRALYKGLSIPLLTSAAQNAILFAVYRKCVSSLSPADERVSMKTSAIASTVAAVAQVPITTNIELIKLRLQMRNIGAQYYSRFSPSPNTAVAGPMTTVKEIITNCGWRGLQRGLSITLLRDVIGFLFYFLPYEYICQSMAGEDSMTTLQVHQLALAGGITGIISWTAIFPLDVIKSRIQVDGIHEPAQYSGMVDCFRKSYRKDGWSVFFRGLGITVVRAFPVNAVTFSVVTLILRFLNVNNREAIL